MELGSRMPPYGVEHISVLIAAAIVTALLVVGARREGLTRRSERALAIAGWVFLAISVAYAIWDLMPHKFTIDQSLPFHLSDVLRFITAWALITRNTLAICITYFWGLTLNLQAVVTPDLNFLFNVPLEFAAYWTFHTVALVTPILFVWGFGFRPTWRGMGASFAALLVWAAVATIVNAFTGANYGYLSHAPAGPSLLDVMGGWPIYLFIAAFALLLGFALMTLPWELLHRRRPAPSIGRFELVRRVAPADAADRQPRPLQ